MVGPVLGGTPIVDPPDVLTSDHAVVVFDGDGPERIPRGAFRPLSRASIRLAVARAGAGGERP